MKTDENLKGNWIFYKFHLLNFPKNLLMFSLFCNSFASEEMSKYLPKGAFKLIFPRKTEKTHRKKEEKLIFFAREREEKSKSYIFFLQILRRFVFWEKMKNRKAISLWIKRISIIIMAFKVSLCFERKVLSTQKNKV